MARSTSGLVLELKADTVLLLTQEGIFLELPRAEVAADAFVGATIPLQLGDEWFGPAPGIAPDHAGDPSGAALPTVPGPGSDRPVHAGLRWWRHARDRWLPKGGAWTGSVRRRAPAVAASVVILLGLGLSLYRLNVVTAYEVAVEINPGVVLEVNSLDSVVRSRATNADGETVLAALDLRGLPVAEAVLAVVRTATDLGFLPRAAVSPVAGPAPLPQAPGTEGPVPGAAGPGAEGTAGGGESGESEDAADASTVAVSVISHSSGAADGAGARVADSLAGTLRVAASETGTVFNAVVQVVTTEELEQARRGTGGETSIAKAVLAAKARERGLELSDDDIAQASVRDLAAMIKERRSGSDEERGRPRLNLFRARPGSDDDNADDDDRAGPRGRGRHDGSDDDRRGLRRGPDRPDDGDRSGPGRGDPRRDDDDDGDRRGGGRGPTGRDEDDRLRGGEDNRDGDGGDRRRGGTGTDRDADRGRGAGADDNDGNGRWGRGRGRSQDGGDDDSDRNRTDRRGARRSSEDDGPGRGARGGDDPSRQGPWERLFEWERNWLPLFNEFRNRQD